MSKHEKVVKFHWASPRDIIAMTHANQFPNEKFPPGIPDLAGTEIENQLVMMAMVRDETGRLIGTLSELEVFGQHGEGEFEVNLTLVIPGRGALFVSQMKSMVYPQLVEPYRIAAEKGEWEGSVTVTHTS